MKTRRASFIAIGVAVFTALSVALSQAAWAQSQAADIAFLRAKAENTDSAIARIDKTLLRMDERIVRLEKIAVRTDERINGLQTQNSLIVRVLIAVFLPLHLVTLGTLFALLTKGLLWGVDRPPKASSGVSPRLGVAP